MSIITATTPRITGMLWPHKLLRLICSRLAVLAALYLTAAAPQAIAQCGPNITLPAEQWSMVGFPCAPGANNTVGNVFGPNLTAATYGVTWIAWQRVYDNAQCVVASGPQDCYKKLTVSDTVKAGDAFWIYSTVAAVLNFSSIGASATPGPYFQFPATAAPTTEAPRYYMFANPYGSTVNWADLHFRGIIGGAQKDWITAEAVKKSLVAANIHYWNGNTYYTRSLTSNPVATFLPKQAAWMEMQRGIPPFATDLQVRVPKPVGAP